MKSSLPLETIEAIVRDYTSGLPCREIVQRNNVAKETVNKYAKLAGLSRPKEASDRPEVACLWCARLCRSRRRVCRTCAEIYSDGEPTSAGALTGGRWIPNRRGVLIWKPDIDSEGTAA